MLNPLPPDRHDGGEEGGAARTDAGRRKLHEGLARNDLISIPYECLQANPLEGNRVEPEV